MKIQTSILNSASLSSVFNGTPYTLIGSSSTSNDFYYVKDVIWKFRYSSSAYNAPDDSYFSFELLSGSYSSSILSYAGPNVGYPVDIITPLNPAYTIDVPASYDLVLRYSGSVPTTGNSTVQIDIHYETQNVTTTNPGFVFGSNVVFLKSISVGPEALSIGTGSLSIGQITTASGEYSVAVGGNTNAANTYTRAEGIATTATGYASHAEGVQTIASGDHSHAEGSFTSASGAHSHAEGSSTKALGNGAHSEGQTTVALGDYSHAAGFNTIASGTYQTVIGRFNTQNNTTDVFVIGGGLNNANRKDIFTVSTSSVTISGSLNISGSVTSTLTGTASWATNALTASNTPDALITASVSSNILTFTKGNGSTFNLTVNTGSGTNPGGTNKAIQFNGLGAFSGSNNFTFNSASNQVQLTGSLIVKSSSVGGIDTVNSYLYDNSNNLVVHWNGAALIHPTTQITTLDWATGLLRDPSTDEVAIDWDSRILYDEGAVTALTFSDVNVSDGVRLYGTSSFALTASFLPVGTYAITSSWAVSASRALTASFLTPGTYSVTASQALTASYTPNALTTASVSSNVLTFTKGNGSTFNLTVNTGSAVVPGGSNTAIQFNSASVFSGSQNFTYDYVYQSLKQGSNVTASANYSHAEGSSTQALADSAHAEGGSTVASALYAHAEGDGSVASGYASHAEGASSQATENYAHAEGYTTIALGNSSHAEGYETRAGAANAHSEGGTGTFAGSKAYLSTDAGSTTPGLVVLPYSDVTTQIGSVIILDDIDYDNIYGRIILGVASVAYNPGNDTTDITLSNSSISTTNALIAVPDIVNPNAADYEIGGYSHAEGSAAKTYGRYSHAEGIGTRALGNSSHAEGGYAVTKGDGSHAEGLSTYAVGIYSHAEGYFSTASGDYSHAEGSQTIAIGNYSHAQGANTVAYGANSFAGGLWTIASGSFQTVFGQYNTHGNTTDLFIIGGGIDNSNRKDVLNVSTTGVVTTGSFTVFTGSSIEFQVTNTGTKLGSAIGDLHQVTGSLNVSGSFRGGIITVPTASGTASMDCSVGNYFTLTLSSSYTMLLSASNIQPGQSINLRIIQPATSGSLSYGSVFKFPNGMPYTASATSSVTDIVTFISYDTASLFGTALKNFI